MLFRKRSFHAIFVGSTCSGLIFGARSNFGAPSRIRTALQLETFDDISTDFWALWRMSGDLLGAFRASQHPLRASFQAQKIPPISTNFM